MGPPKLSFHPPLLNSAGPWATTKTNLRDLLLSPHTGAITTRTSLIKGFTHRPEDHRYVFFDPATAAPSPAGSTDEPDPGKAFRDAAGEAATGTLNSLEYSPVSLGKYIKWLVELSTEIGENSVKKTVIISVTGAPEDFPQCYEAIVAASKSGAIQFPVAMEINLSCPNDKGTPPVPYVPEAMRRHLRFLPPNPAIPVGIKMPPLVERSQSVAFLDIVKQYGEQLSFITAVNTLGMCLLLDVSTSGGNGESQDPAQPWLAHAALPGSGFGGMAGPSLHPLALGNVATLRNILSGIPELSHIDIIGVGGVSDGSGYRRMKAAGAMAVGVGSGVARHGVSVFEGIDKDIESKW